MWIENLPPWQSERSTRHRTVETSWILISLIYFHLERLHSEARELQVQHSVVSLYSGNEFRGRFGDKETSSIRSSPSQTEHKKRQTRLRWNNDAGRPDVFLRIKASKGFGSTMIGKMAMSLNKLLQRISLFSCVLSKRNTKMLRHPIVSSTFPAT